MQAIVPQGAGAAPLVPIPPRAPVPAGAHSPAAAAGCPGGDRPSRRGHAARLTAARGKWARTPAPRLPGWLCRRVRTGVLLARGGAELLRALVADEDRGLPFAPGSPEALARDLTSRMHSSILAEAGPDAGPGLRR